MLSDAGLPAVSLGAGWMLDAGCWMLDAGKTQRVTEGLILN